MQIKAQLEKYLKKYDEMSVSVKAGLWFTICGLLQKGISFLTTPIFTRLLTTEQYGTVSVYNSWELIVTIFCTLNLFYGGFNNGMRDHKDKRDNYLAAIQGLITVITAIWFAIYVLSRPFWNSLLEMNTYLIVIMFFQILMQAALSLWSAKERFEFRYKLVVIITLLNTILGTVLPIFAILLCDDRYGAEAKIITHAMSVILICGFIYIYNLRKGKVFFDKEIWINAILFNLPLLPHYLSTRVLNQADRIMISKMVGTSEAGIYSVAYSASMVLNILTTAINNSFAPWIYGEIEYKRYKSVGKVSNMLFAGVAVVLMILISFAPECIYILAGRKYADAVIIIPSVAASLYFIFMYQIFANVEFYYKKNKFIAYASVVGAIMNVILNYIGIKLFGYVAAGYTTLICYIIFGIAHYVFMKKICKKELPGVALFDAKMIFAIAAVLVLFTIVMTMLYHYSVIRYSILLCIIAILMINRKTVLKYAEILKKK